MGLQKSGKAEVNQSFHLLVFFTYGNSLETWAKAGLLGRELLIYQKMAEQGSTVTLFTYGDQKDERYLPEWEGIHIIPIYKYTKKRRNRWINLFCSFLIPFSHKLRQEFTSATIYKTNQMSGAWIPLILSVRYKKPLVVRCGFEMLRNLLRGAVGGAKKTVVGFCGYLFELLVYVAADKIFISSQSDLQFIKRFFPINQNKIHLIRNFIDTQLFTPGKKKEKKNSVNKMLYIGRLSPEKNLGRLIHAVKETQFYLDIVGAGSFQHKYEKLAEGAKNIRFIGLVPNGELPALIRQYDLFVLVSFYECSPKSLLEAMACERVVMGSSVEGIQELIIEGKTGFLCQTDINSIRQTISHIFDKSDKALNIISKNARQFVLNECALDVIVRKEMGIYRELIT